MFFVVSVTRGLVLEFFCFCSHLFGVFVCVCGEMGLRRLVAAFEVFGCVLVTIWSLSKVIERRDMNGADLKTKRQNIVMHEFASNIIVSEVTKLIYCPIPKVANSNWKYVIRKLEGMPDFANLSHAHNVNTSNLRYLSDYSSEEAVELLKDKRYLKFLFVRDPYTRLASCYLDKFQNKEREYTQNEYRRFLAAAFGWRIARNTDVVQSARPSFARFVTAISTQRTRSMNAHWRPQTQLCGWGIMPYDFVGRMERVQADAKLVLRRFGNDAQFPSREEIGFKGSGASDQAVVDDLYNVKLMFLVRLIYRHDFQHLGYL